MATQLKIARARGEPSAVPFGAADFAWEQSQEAAIRAFRARGMQAALLHWRRGLAIARQRFERDDPRLATSLTNMGFIQGRLDDHAAALRDFEEADAVFQRGWRWLLGMTRPDAPDEVSVAQFRRLLDQAARSNRALRSTGELPVGLLERWRSERPLRGSDLRKLLGAAFLVASRAQDAQPNDRSF